MRKAVPAVIFLFLAAALIPLAAQPAANERWLHVRIEKTGEKGESVRVNLPLSVAEKVLPAIKSHEMEEGRIKFDHPTINGIDIRALLEAVRALGDGEFVTIEGENESVRVAKEGGYLIAKVDERRGKGERVDVKIPLRIVEALLSGGPDELNLQAALQALSAGGDEVLVTVESDDEMVRVWVDSKSTSE